MNLSGWLGVFLGFATATSAQWLPEELLPRNLRVQTTGGIAYLKFTYDFMCPQGLAKFAPSRAGTNLYQRVFLVNNGGGCVAIFPPPVYTSEATLVLGQFEPGDYKCEVNTSMSGPGLIPWRIPFTVTPESMVGLMPINNQGIAFNVAGTSNVTYRVLSSTALTNWTIFRTMEGAPFTITDQPAANTFYRVEITDRVRMFP
jgi:hypothetical protein